MVTNGQWEIRMQAACFYVELCWLQYVFKIKKTGWHILENACLLQTYFNHFKSKYPVLTQWIMRNSRIYVHSMFGHLFCFSISKHFLETAEMEGINSKILRRFFVVFKERQIICRINFLKEENWECEVVQKEHQN